MNTITRAMSVASVLLLPLGSAVGAATIDFTARSTFETALYANDFGVSGVIDGVTWVLTPTPGRLTYNFPAGNGVLTGPDNGYDGVAKPGGALAFEGDGLGLQDDEFRAPDQYATLTFSKPVRLRAVHFLDLYYSTLGIEQVQIGGDVSALVSATQELQPLNPIGGYRRQGFSGSESVLSIRFTPTGTGRGDQGDKDFALAGVEIAPIPLPAGAALLLGALAGLGALKRRKRHPRAGAEARRKAAGALALRQIGRTVATLAKGPICLKYANNEAALDRTVLKPEKKAVEKDIFSNARSRRKIHPLNE